MRRGRAAPARAQIGVDDMDVFKGIELKLAAYECLLNAHPELHGKVSLIQARPPVSPAARWLMHLSERPLLKSGYNMRGGFVLWRAR